MLLKKVMSFMCLFQINKSEGIKCGLAKGIVQRAVVPRHGRPFLSPILKLHIDVSWGDPTLVALSSRPSEYSLISFCRKHLNIIL